MFKSIWKLLKFGFKAIVFFIIVSIMVEIGDAIFKVSESEDIVFDFSIPKLLCLGAYIVICIVILKKIFFSSSGSKYSSHYTPASTYVTNTPKTNNNQHISLSTGLPIPYEATCVTCSNLCMRHNDKYDNFYYCTARKTDVHPSDRACNRYVG